MDAETGAQRWKGGATTPWMRTIQSVGAHWQTPFGSGRPPGSWVSHGPAGGAGEKEAEGEGAGDREG